MLIQELLTIDKSKLINWGNDFITSVFDMLNEISEHKDLGLPILKLKFPVKKITKEGSNNWKMDFKTSVKNIDVEFILDFSDNYLTYVTCEFNDGRESVDGWSGHTEIVVNYNVDKLSAEKAAKKYFNINDRQSLSSLIKMFYYR